MSFEKTKFKKTITEYLDKDKIDAEELARLLNKFLEDDKLRVTSTKKNKVRMIKTISAP